MINEGMPEVGDLLLGYRTATEGGIDVRPSLDAPTTEQTALLAEIMRRLGNFEGAIDFLVPNDQIMSRLLLTKEAALLASDKVAIVGEVTFADWHRDVTGRATGEVEASLTQIRGGVIRTEKIENWDGDSYIDLDAGTSGHDIFIKCKDAITINADGTFVFGGANAAKRLVYDGTKLTLGKDNLLYDTTVNDVINHVGETSGNPHGATLEQIEGDLDDIEDGSDYFKTTLDQRNGGGRGFVALNITCDYIRGISTQRIVVSEDNPTNGMVIDAQGLRLYGGGVLKVHLRGSDGYGYFAGELAAASGTFEGNLQASGNVNTNGYVRALGSYAVGETFTCLYGERTGVSGHAVTGIITNASNGEDAIHAETYGTGAALRAYALCDNANVTGVYAVSYYNINSVALHALHMQANGIAFHCEGRMAKTGEELITHLNADMVDSLHVTGFILNTTAQDMKFKLHIDGGWKNVTLRNETW